MSDEEKKPGARHWLLSAIVIVALYVLSVGPVRFLDGAAHHPNIAVRVIYEPLELFAREVPTVGNVLSDYGDAFYEGPQVPLE